MGRLAGKIAIVTADTDLTHTLRRLHRLNDL